MDQNYLVSICVPVYNVERYIERCVVSIMEQTYDNIEVVFVDDASPDRSVDIINDVVSRYGDKKNRIRILQHESNKGLAAARNTGVNNAQGEFIVHVDSDDWIEANAVELLVKKQMETGADIVSGNAIAHYDDHDAYLNEPTYTDKIDMLKGVIKLTLDHVIWRRLIRTRLYKDNNIYAVEGINIGEDHHTLPRLVFYSNGFAKIDDYIYHYNCCNIESYMKKGDYNKEQIRIDNDMRSIDTIEKFFVEKDPRFVNDIIRVRVERLLGCLYTYLRFRKREMYIKTWNEVLGLKQYWNNTSLNNWIKRIVYSNYNINLLRSRICHGI